VAEIAIVAFVFTDLEGSTAKWDSDGAQMNEALELHGSLAHSAFGRHAFLALKHTGDAHMPVAQIEALAKEFVES
jgi:class 3 adenylate cyclase